MANMCDHSSRQFEIIYLTVQTAVSKAGVSIKLSVLIVCVGPAPLIDDAATVVVQDSK